MTTRQQWPLVQADVRKLGDCMGNECYALTGRERRADYHIAIDSSTHIYLPGDRLYSLKLTRRSKRGGGRFLVF